MILANSTGGHANPQWQQGNTTLPEPVVKCHYCHTTIGETGCYCTNAARDRAFMSREHALQQQPHHLSQDDESS